MKLRIGRETWRIDLTDKLPYYRVGVADYQKNTITLAAFSGVHNPTRQTKHQIRKTFWHELTHAMLDALGEERLKYDETFVRKFSTALTQVLDQVYDNDGSMVTQCLERLRNMRSEIPRAACVETLPARGNRANKVRGAVARSGGKIRSTRPTASGGVFVSEGTARRTDADKAGGETHGV